MNKLKIISLTASMVLALVFTFSCSSDDVNEGESSSSGGGGNLPGSSSGGGNGGGEEKFSYCIKDGFCHEGPYTLESCSSWGIPSNNCPNGGGGGSSSSGGEAGNSFSYCLINGQCFSGPFTSKECGDLGGLPNNSCNGGGDKGNDIGNYRTKQIGTQTWMAENLNYNVSGSKCYNNSDSNCNTYGRLYDWSTAMNLPSSCNSSSCSSQIQSKHRGICPSGWHIPSNDEWNTLLNYVLINSGCSSCDARLLKNTSGWYNNGNGTDQYGFSALPGGYGYSDGSFYNVGNFGYWWSASEYESNSDNAYYRGMYYGNVDAIRSSYRKSYLHSVRCLQD